MESGKLYKREYGEMTTVKSIFQRRVCQLLEGLVLSTEAKHGKNMEIYFRKKPKFNSSDDIKIKILV